MQWYCAVESSWKTENRKGKMGTKNSKPSQIEIGDQHLHFAANKVFRFALEELRLVRPEGPQE